MKSTMNHAARFLFTLCAAAGCRSDGTDPPSPGSPAEQTDSPRGAAVNPDPGASPTIVSPTDPAAPPPSTAPAPGTTAQPSPGTSSAPPAPGTTAAPSPGTRAGAGPGPSMMNDAGTGRIPPPKTQ